MADLMGVMLKSLGVNGSEIMQTAEDMRGMVGEIHGMLTTLVRQNDMIICHLGEFATRDSALALESEKILTRMITDGQFGDGASGDAD
jgi:hypothetical protein